MERFEGQTVLVIGGSSGMGRGAARAVAARGGDVIVTSRSEERLEAAKRSVSEGLEPAPGITKVGRVDAVVCDLGNEASVRAAVNACARLDHLVVTAAPGKGGTDRDFFEGKFWGSVVAARAAGERLPAHGSILLVSGGLAVRPQKGQWAVTCAFAAVEALVRAMAVELRPRRVNGIRPGLFDTATWADMEPAAREAFLRERSAKLPVGRPGQPDDFGEVAAALLSAGYLTGQVVILDGGEALLGG